MKDAMRRVLLAALLCPSFASAQIYKCVDAKGRTVFQEAPCDGDLGANRVKVMPSSGGFDAPKRPDAGDAPAASTRKEAPVAEAPAKATAPTRSASQAENRRFITTGMSRDQVESSLGPPDRTRRRDAYRATPTSPVIVESHYAFYEPGPGDPETRTTILYVGEAVELVKRDVVRAK